MDAPIRESDARMSDVSHFRRIEESTSKDAPSSTRNSGIIENAAGISGFRGEENRQEDASPANRTLVEILKVIQELKYNLWNSPCQVRDNLAADASKVSQPLGQSRHIYLGDAHYDTTVEKCKLQCECGGTILITIWREKYTGRPMGLSCQEVEFKDPAAESCAAFCSYFRGRRSERLPNRWDEPQNSFQQNFPSRLNREGPMRRQPRGHSEYAGNQRIYRRRPTRQYYSPY